MKKKYYNEFHFYWIQLLNRLYIPMYEIWRISDARSWYFLAVEVRRLLWWHIFSIEYQQINSSYRKERKKNNGGFKLRPTFSTGLALMNFFSDVLATRLVIKIVCALSIKYLHPEGQQCQIHKAVSLMWTQATISVLFRMLCRNLCLHRPCFMLSLTSAFWSGWSSLWRMLNSLFLVNCFLFVGREFRRGIGPWCSLWWHSNFQRWVNYPPVSGQQ